MESGECFSGWLGVRLFGGLGGGRLLRCRAGGRRRLRPVAFRLLDPEVTTVSRKSERPGDTPSAVYVLTADELRLGVTSLPEALRHVPGVVGGAWAIAAGGIDPPRTGRPSVIALVDGQSVYSFRQILGR